MLSDRENHKVFMISSNLSVCAKQHSRHCSYYYPSATDKMSSNVKGGLDPRAYVTLCLEMAQSGFF